MATYKTPDVYVEEISTLPPSVVGVSTAIPAFIGYTEKASDEGKDLTNKPTKISTMLEYKSLFGGAKGADFSVAVDASDNITSVTPPTISHLMYYHLDLYFKNGGGACYIVSVGDYSATAAKAHYDAGLAALESEDEPTLIMISDAVATLAEADYYGLCQAVLAQCAKLKDRFGIFDVLSGDTDASNFRTGIGTNNLKYGAVYYPPLNTALNYEYTESEVAITGVDESLNTLAKTETAKTGLYNNIKTELAKERVTLYPSGAMAGVYAAVDRDRGVWKAPANVSLASVLSPTVEVTNDEQEGLNVDATAGKSVNAIRTFSGKGVLVWGARTLAGNDNEWRYISVRRLFNLIEESTKKASAFAVFEPNDASTWLKVKSAIDSYLYGLWQQGALTGSKPDSAYFVNVGLGSTMTSQDVLEGRMIVEIGVAAVRPAEFIILRFSHKLQEA